VVVVAADCLAVVGDAGSGGCSRMRSKEKRVRPDCPNCRRLVLRRDTRHCLNCGLLHPHDLGDKPLPRNRDFIDSPEFPGQVAFGVFVVVFFVCFVGGLIWLLAAFFWGEFDLKWLGMLPLVAATVAAFAAMLSSLLTLFVPGVVEFIDFVREERWNAKSRAFSSVCLLAYENSLLEIRGRLASRVDEWERRVRELSGVRGDSARLLSDTSNFAHGPYRGGQVVSDGQKRLVESFDRTTARLHVLRRRLEEVNLLLKLICLDRVLLKVASVADVEPEDGKTVVEIQELLRQCDLIEREGRSICHEIGSLPNAMSVEEQVVARITDVAFYIDRLKSLSASESAGYSGGERELFAKPGSGVRIEADLFQKVVSSVSDELKEDRLWDEGVDTRKERGR
jgi:hypothetical protein